MSTNIGYWEQVLQAPTPAYQELFNTEHKYLVNNIPSKSKVLDIGCGEGRNIKSILEVTPNVYGVDNDIKAVEDAKKNLPNIEVVQGEAVNLPYEDKTFDVVTFLMILPNLDNGKEKAFKEVSRVLKDNGFVILSTFAETAFEERMRVYNQVNIPIEKIEGTRLTFKNGVISEQFSLKEIETLAKKAGLNISNSQKVGNIAYICKLEKINK